jgi:hypothetical protein
MKPAPPSTAPLPPPPPIFDDYPQFLEGVADWIEQQAHGRHVGLACEAVRAGQDAWFGVGVYTVCELFFDAGMCFISKTKRCFL